MTTGYRTYYTIDKTKLAAFPVKADPTNTGSFVTGESWTVCNTLTNGIVCNGGSSVFTGPHYKYIVNRIGY